MERLWPYPEMRMRRLLSLENHQDSKNRIVRLDRGGKDRDAVESIVLLPTSALSPT